MTPPAYLAYYSQHHYYTWFMNLSWGFIVLCQRKLLMLITHTDKTHSHMHNAHLILTIISIK